MSNQITIYEVGPRDGLQNEATPFATPDKLRFVDQLVDAGLAHIELTSFVHPKAVPQMADADEIMTTTLARHGDKPIRFVGLVLNERGYDRAYAAGCRAMAFGVSVSDTFSQENTRMSNKEALSLTQKLINRAREDGVWVRVYLMTAWVCPFEGPTPPPKTIAYAEEIWRMGIDEFAIADTIGHAHPLEVGRMFDLLGRKMDMRKLAAHLHDTQALGLANAAAAISAGVRTLDSSLGGLGGCPFAPGAAGNLATEDLVFMAYKMGFGTGVDFERLWELVNQNEPLIGRRIGGRIRSWWESVCELKPDVKQP